VTVARYTDIQSARFNPGRITRVTFAGIYTVVHSLTRLANNYPSFTGKGEKYTRCVDVIVLFFRELSISIDS
jgi:hypothetical protein